MLFWEAWKVVAHRAGGYQSRVVLGVVYLLVLGPAAVVARLGGNRLMDMDSRPGAGSWQVRGPQDATVEALRRQF